MDWEEFKEKFNKTLDKTLFKEFILKPGGLYLLQEKMKTSDRHYVLLFLEENPRYIKGFFDSLVYYVCAGDKRTSRNCEDLIFRFRKWWKIENIREPINSVLLSAGENPEIYFRALKLLVRLKNKQTDEFAREIAEKAIKHDDQDMQKVGKWAIENIEIDGEIILKEKSDRWEIPLQGLPVNLIYVDSRFGLSFYGPGVDADIYIESEFTYKNSNNQEFKLKPGEDFTKLGAALDLLHKKIQSADAFKNGKLVLTFHDNSVVTVNHSVFEAWNIVGTFQGESIQIICLNGGELCFI